MKVRTFFVPIDFKQKADCYGLVDMEQHNQSTENKGSLRHDDQYKSPVNPSSENTSTNLNDSEFSELEKSRMENPPEHREENGTDGNDVDNSTSTHQQDGV